MRGILMYHSIDPTGSPISMAPEVFQRQLDWLAEERVRVVGLAELLELPDDAEAVALTFDDAFANFESEAWPRLAERELPATLFVVSGEVGRTNRWGGTGRAAIPELPLMDWAGLERVARAGVSIGTHSRTHPRFYGLDRGRLERELCGARADLEERIGATCGVFAWPYGDCDRRARRAAREVFACACGTDQRILRSGDDPFDLPRLDASYLAGVRWLEEWGSRAFGRFVRRLTWRGRLRRIPERLEILLGGDPR